MSNLYENICSKYICKTRKTYINMNINLCSLKSFFFQDLLYVFMYFYTNMSFVHIYIYIYANKKFKKYCKKNITRIVISNNTIYKILIYTRM